jgi:hypothetical protein
MTCVRDIPRVHTPEGGYGDVMPAPVLTGCDEPRPEGAPDLRGVWRAVDARDGGGEPLADDHPVQRHVERIEQAGDRVIVTAGGVVHDMVVDGTLENGVNDVMAVDLTTAISVAATYEGGVLVLRPQGFPGVEVRRWREGEVLVWQYHTAFTVRLERVSSA